MLIPEFYLSSPPIVYSMDLTLLFLYMALYQNVGLYFDIYKWLLNLHSIENVNKSDKDLIYKSFDGLREAHFSFL